MNSTLPIGDFSRATHQSVKMLRHYHEIGLLEPVDVDVDTRYRRYATESRVLLWALLVVGSVARYGLIDSASGLGAGSLETAPGE